MRREKYTRVNATSSYWRVFVVCNRPTVMTRLRETVLETHESRVARMFHTITIVASVYNTRNKYFMHPPVSVLMPYPSARVEQVGTAQHCAHLPIGTNTLI